MTVREAAALVQQWSLDQLVIIGGYREPEPKVIVSDPSLRFHVDLCLYRTLEVPEIGKVFGRARFHYDIRRDDPDPRGSTYSPFDGIMLHNTQPIEDDLRRIIRTKGDEPNELYYEPKTCLIECRLMAFRTDLEIDNVDVTDWLIRIQEHLRLCKTITLLEKRMRDEMIRGIAIKRHDAMYRGYNRYFSRISDLRHT